MINQFVVSPQLQQFLQGVDSPRLLNVVWDKTFGAANLPTLPTNPKTVRRSLIFDRLTSSADATPVVEYNAFLMNIDGSNVQQVTFDRGV